MCGVIVHNSVEQIVKRTVYIVIVQRGIEFRQMLRLSCVFCAVFRVDFVIMTAAPVRSVRQIRCRSRCSEIFSK
ncbi:MAG: hypothetical protein D3914_05725 [Candidatus Electrothrix sp. LOE2]|nr:hypothetical protein [Candidatus Electrothrix sp. LOE2]